MLASATDGRRHSQTGQKLREKDFVEEQVGLAVAA
jgi:hypothetical protein